MYTYFLFPLFLFAQAIPAHAPDGAKRQVMTIPGREKQTAISAENSATGRLFPALPLALSALVKDDDAASVALGEPPDLTLVGTVASKRHPIGAVLKTPIPSLYQIDIGSEIYYLSQNGRYLLEGDLIDLKTRKNLTETHRDAIRLAAVNSIPLSDLIIYPALGENKYAVTVFSDIDCPYCRVLHEHLDEYRSRGIEVRFAAFPRTGIDSPDYRKAAAVWCAEDRNAALNRASQGVSVGERDCQAPVEREYLIGMKIGINTTPSFILEDGTLISGFVAPENLVRIIEGERNAPR